MSTNGFSVWSIFHIVPRFNGSMKYYIIVKKSVAYVLNSKYIGFTLMCFFFIRKSFFFSENLFQSKKVKKGFL